LQLETGVGFPSRGDLEASQPIRFNELPAYGLMLMRALLLNAP
jgi:hypothetical protein